MSNSHKTTDYLSINVSGNASVVLGDVYGSNAKVFSHAARVERSNYLRQSLRDAPEQADERSLAIFSELSILTLLDYEYVKSVIHKLRYYGARAGVYAKKIGVRQSIFRTSLLALLVPSAGIDLAQKMVADSQHTMWTNEDFLCYLRDCFGTNVNTIQDVLELISRDLNAIADLGEKCLLARTESSKVGSLTLFDLT